MAFRYNPFFPPLHKRYPVRKAAARILPDRAYAKLAFLCRHGRLPRTQPRTFNERISNLVGSGALERLRPYCDKLAARELVARKIGAKYLVPLLATADRLTPDLWDRLPDAFMLKPNHGSSWYRLIRDKRAESFDELATVTANWLNKDYYYYYREGQYRGIEPVLLFEQVLYGDRVDELVDYKFFCFHGKAMMVYVMWEKPVKHRLLYDLAWNKLAVRYEDPNDGHHPRPAALEEMRSVAETLAKGFEFVRVDLFSAPEGVFFGELTFTPLVGADRFDPPAFDAFLGALWDDPGGSRAGEMAQWREPAAPPAICEGGSERLACPRP